MGFPGCVTCHSNHAIKHPTDEMIGTGPKAVCMNCHTAGDAGSMQAEAMHAQLTNLASAIAASDELLGRAERQGMEVSQPKLQQTQARDALLKARVAVHAFRDSELKRDTDAGLAITQQTYAAGAEGDAGMEVPACRAGAIAGDDRPHAGGAGVLHQEIGTEVRGPTLRFTGVLDRPVGRPEPR